MSSDSVDWDVVDLIARERKQSHDGTRQAHHKAIDGQDKMNMDRIGAAAEVDFASRFDLPPPRVDLIEGDNGYDFLVNWDGETTKVEIKASDYRNPNLIVPSIRDIEAPDVYVLYSAKYHSYIRPIGWIQTTDFMEKSEKQDSKIGDYCRYLDAEKLNDLPPEGVIRKLEDNHATI